MKAFENDALRRFEDEMVVHSKEFTPRLCKVIGDEQLRVALRARQWNGPTRMDLRIVGPFGSISS